MSEIVLPIWKIQNSSLFSWTDKINNLPIDIQEIFYEVLGAEMSIPILENSDPVEYLPTPQQQAIVRKAYTVIDTFYQSYNIPIIRQKLITKLYTDKIQNQIVVGHLNDYFEYLKEDTCNVSVILESEEQETLLENIKYSLVENTLEIHISQDDIDKPLNVDFPYSDGNFIIELLYGICTDKDDCPDNIKTMIIEGVRFLYSQDYSGLSGCIANSIGSKYKRFRFN